MKSKKKIGLILALISLLILGSFLYWANDTYKPEEEALKALKTNEGVVVNQSDNIIFSPKNRDPKTGIIFYPGGKVEPEAYAPIAHKISKKGYKVIITPMTLNLAVLNSDKATSVIKEHQNTETWIMAGHSLGGSMAAKYSSENPGKIAGLIMLAAYPPDNSNLKNKNLSAISIYGTKDEIIDKDKVESNKDLLPKDRVIKVIQGGNHAQFGSYGEQSGDGLAGISWDRQQNITLNVILNYLKRYN